MVSGKEKYQFNEKKEKIFKNKVLLNKKGGY